MHDAHSPWTTLQRATYPPPRRATGAASQPASWPEMRRPQALARIQRYAHPHSVTTSIATSVRSRASALSVAVSTLNM